MQGGFEGLWVRHIVVKLFSFFLVFVENQGQQLVFGVAIAIASGQIALTQVFALGFGSQEVVKPEHITSIGIFWRFQGRAIGLDAHHLLFEFFFGQENINVVVVRLAHFLAVGTGNGHYLLVYFGGRHYKYFLLVLMVDFLGDVARNFQMLLLVFAYGHKMGIVEQNIGGHQYRIGKKPCRNIGFAQFLGLVFVRVGIFQHRKGRKAAQVPSQFAYLRNARLAVEVVFFYIKTKGQPSRCHGIDIVGAQACLADGGERVQVGNKEKGLVFGVFRKPNCRNNGPQQIAEVGLAGALYACEDSCHSSILYQDDNKI